MSFALRENPSPPQRTFFLLITTYYMAVSHKDWELPNSRIWLAEIDIDHGLDFPVYGSAKKPDDKNKVKRTSKFRQV